MRTDRDLWPNVYCSKIYLEKGTILKDYVLRIYRRGKNDPRILVGVVEEVGVGGDKAFSNLDELWSILNPSRTRAARTMKPDKPNKLDKPNQLNELNEPNKPDKLNKPLKHRKQREL